MGQLLAGRLPGAGSVSAGAVPAVRGPPTASFLCGGIAPTPKPRFSPAPTEPPRAPAALPGSRALPLTPQSPRRQEEELKPVPEPLGQGPTGL